MADTWKMKGIHPIIKIEWACLKKADGMHVSFKDGVYYLPYETDKVKFFGGVTKNIHNIKKIFKGIII